jgi:serine/arginine repetitive matrix protein 2
MEEDDDNFLDGVIEFGDGRQYKIQPAEAPAQPTGPPGGMQHDVRSSPPSGETPLAPVSKEERFADDDYDRSWPRSKTSPAIPQRESPPHSHHPIPPSPSSSQATHSPQDASRVLFNERSNKLEPYSSAHPPHRPGPGPSTHPLHRKASFAEAGSPITDPRVGRDLPPHTQATNVQLLQKPGTPFGDAPTRPGPFGPIAAGSTTINKDRPRDIRRQGVISSGQDPSRVKDHLGPISTLDSKDREGMGALRGRRLSNMGPPMLTSARDRSKETGRQLPPHLSQMPAPPLPLQRRLSSKEPQPRPPSTVPSDSPSSRRPSFAHHPSQSPVLSHGSVTSETPSQTLSAHPVDLEQYHKTTMHLSAERAKQRRQQEEEERAKQRERARQKAAELEAKAKESAAETPAKPDDESKPLDTEVSIPPMWLFSVVILTFRMVT